MNSLSSNEISRKESEKKIQEYQKQDGFALLLLKIIEENHFPNEVIFSSAITFKNKILNDWKLKQNSRFKTMIKDDEKLEIKKKVIELLISKYSNPQICEQLKSTINEIFKYEKWNDVSNIIFTLLGDFHNIENLEVGLLLLCEYVRSFKKKEYFKHSSDTEYNFVINDTFPYLEKLIKDYIRNEFISFHRLIYLIIKIFKFSIYVNLPFYLQAHENIDFWIQIHFFNITESIAQKKKKTDSYSDKNIENKTLKWCFYNLNKLLFFCIKKNQAKLSIEYIEHFMNFCVPKILDFYWKVIGDCIELNIWVDETSIFHIITFLENLIDTSAFYLIESKLDFIIKNIILFVLNFNEKKIDFYNEDPREAARVLFDFNNNFDSPDVASMNFLYKLSKFRPDLITNIVFPIVNNIFILRLNNKNDLNIAKQMDGALNVFSIIFYVLEKKNSPIYGKINEFFYVYVNSELSDAVIDKTPWLTARSLNTLALYNFSNCDHSMLNEIFQNTLNCFHRRDNFPVQLTSVDFLSTLVDNEYVSSAIADMSPLLMEEMLKISNNFESEILLNAMEIFVQKFSRNLKPYALKLANHLSDRFYKVTTVLFDSNNYSLDFNDFEDNNEYQADGIMNIITNLVISMCDSPEICQSLEKILEGVLKLIYENTLVLFLKETSEILESLIFSSKFISDTVWSIFQSCLNTFDTYGYDYVDDFIPFFHCIINFGFVDPNVTYENPNVKSLLSICFNILKSKDPDPEFTLISFQLIEQIILAMNNRLSGFLKVLLFETFDSFLILEEKNIVDKSILSYTSILKVFFASMYVDSAMTFSFFHEKKILNLFYDLWNSNLKKFCSIYDYKLTILCCLSILKFLFTSHFLQEYIPQTVAILISNLIALSTLTKTTANANADLNKIEEINCENEHNPNYDGYDLEILTNSPIHNINVFTIFLAFITDMKQNDPDSLRLFFLNVNKSDQDVLNKIMLLMIEEK